jgi:hypothetical protein
MRHFNQFGPSKLHSGHLYFAAISLQRLHLIISCLAQFGHLNLVVPVVFVMRFLQDEHTSFSSAISGWDWCFIYKDCEF